MAAGDRATEGKARERDGNSSIAVGMVSVAAFRAQLTHEG